MNKKLIKIFLISFVALFIMISVIFAQYSERDGGWKQQITSMSLAFTVNDEAITSVSNNSLGLISRGQESDLEFKVKVVSNYQANSLAKYKFIFYLIDEYNHPDEYATATEIILGPDIDYSNNELARAIEVYQYINGSYEYISNLSDLQDYEYTAEVEVSDLLGSLHENTHNFKLVYSAAAGDYYEGKGFLLHMEASITSTTSSDKLYISNSSELMYESGLAEKNEGKTIVLSNDITLNAGSYNFYKIGIDLNGHKLELLRGANININYEGSNPLHSHLGIFDNAPPASYKGISGEGVIIINCPDDIYYIQDNLLQSFGNIQITSYSFEKLAEAVSSQTAAMTNKFYYPGSSIDFIKNLNYYFLSFEYFKNNILVADEVSPVGDAVLRVNEEDSKIIQFNDGKPIINPAYSAEATLVKSLQLSLANGMYSSSIDLKLTIRGSGVESIADYIMANYIPNTITGSLFLPSYDLFYKATFTWVTSDNLFFDGNGSYLKLGQSGLENRQTIEDLLENWNDRTIKVGLIVDLYGEQTYREKNVTIEIFNAKERTDRIYNYQQSILVEEESLLEFNKCINTEYASRASLSGFGLTIYTNTNYDTDQKKDYVRPVVVSEENGISKTMFVDVVNNKIVLTYFLEEDSPSITLSNTEIIENGFKATYNGIIYTVIQKSGIYYLEAETVNPSNFVYIDLYYAFRPQGDKISIIETEYTFIYNNNGNRIDYTIPKDITALGYKSTVELSDPGPFLQEDFITNTYISGESFEFTVKAYTSQGAFVNYIVPDLYKNYIYVENGIFGIITNINDNSGKFINIDGTYYFITNRYDENNAISPNGDTIIIKGTEYSYKEQVALGNIANHYARFRIIPSNVPAIEEITATITAICYNFNEFGLPVYITVDDEIMETQLTLVISGIYHNVAGEIADFALYQKLLHYFDKNNNGWIEVKEAKVSWVQLLINTSTLSHLTPLSTTANANFGGNYRYLNFDSLGITRLKGLEYFTGGIEGLSLSGNAIPDLSSLSRLYDLKYINLTNCNVTNIESLQYLDKLAVLQLGTNIISDISPLQYLQNIKYLDLSYNNSLRNFLPISNYEKLTYLSVVQQTSDITNTMEVIYALSLVAGKCSAVNVKIYLNSTSAEWQVSNAQIVAALALSELIVIDEAYTTLYVPSSYKYLGTTYNIKWGITNLNDLQYLSFIEDSNGTTIGYKINSPIVDRTIGLSVSVTDPNSPTGVAMMSRMITIKLLSAIDDSKIPRIQIANNNNAASFLLARDVIPDPILLDKLFQLYNTNTTGYVGTSSYLEQYTLSYAEITTNPSLSVTDLSNLGITDLTGLHYFAVAYNGKSLLLNGNILKNADISEIALMNGLTSLTLTGQKFDFATLIPDSGARLTTLTRLNVYGSYDLDDDDVLKGLYKVYLANPNLFNIYKDSSTAIWDPYAKLMPLYAQSLPSVFVFKNVGETKSYYYGNDTYYTFRFYDQLDINFQIQTVAYQQVGTLPTGTFTSEGSTGNFTGIKYNTLVGQNDTGYARITLRGNDGKSTIDRQHSIILKCEFNQDIVVTNYNGNKTVSLDIIFPGRSLRTVVMTKIAPLIIANTYYNASDNKHYLTMEILKSLNFSEYTAASPLSIDGTYYNSTANYNGVNYYEDKSATAITGLQYTSIKHISIFRDANLGDGSAILQLNSLSIFQSVVDLTKLNKTFDYSNITSLKIGNEIIPASPTSYIPLIANRYFKAVDNSGYNYLGLFKKLEVLHIICSTVRDWGFLSALVNLDGNGINHIKELKIYSTDLVTIFAASPTSTTLTMMNFFNNMNSNGQKAAGIVKEIYGNSTALTKTYYIGSPESDVESTYLFDPNTWPEFSLGITNIDAEKEFNEFKSSINVLGTKIDGTLYYNSSREPVNTIYLPKSTYDFMLGTDYKGSDGYFNRGFEIKWILNGIDAATAISLFGNPVGVTFVNITNALGGIAVYVRNDAHKDITLTISSSKLYDCYILLEGIIGTPVTGANNSLPIDSINALGNPGYYYPEYISGVFTGNYLYATYTFASPSISTFESFIYPLLIRADNNPTKSPQAPSGYLSYAEFTDISLRTAAYIIITKHGNHNSGGYIDPKTSGTTAERLSSIYAINLINTDTYAIPASYMTYSVLANGGTTGSFYSASANANFLYLGTNGSFDTYAMNTYSLDGIGKVFTGLLDLTINYQWITNINGLAPLASTLRTVNFMSNLISDVSVFRNFTNLQSVNLQLNCIKTIKDPNSANGASVFAASRTVLNTLDLMDNINISPIDLEALSKTSFTSATIFNLRLARTACVYQNDTYKHLAEMIRMRGSTSNTSFNFYLTVGGTSSTNPVRMYYNGNLPQLFYDTIISEDARNIRIQNNAANNIDDYIKNGIDFSNLNTINGSTVQIGSVSYTLRIINLANITTFAASNNASVMLEVTSDSSVNGSTQFIARFEIGLYFGTVSKEFTLRSTAVSPIMTKSDFDPAMWAYLTSEFTAAGRGTPDDNGLIIYNLTTINITTDIGLKSLKGLHKLTGLTSITISNNQYITELWNADMPALTTLHLRLIRRINTTISTEQLLSAIGYCTRLTLLNLYDFQIDYLKPITFNSTETSLANIITALPLLTTLSTTNCYNLNAYNINGTTCIAQAAKSIMENGNKFMNYTLANSACTQQLDGRAGNGNTSFATAALSTTVSIKRIYYTAEKEVFLNQTFTNATTFGRFMAIYSAPAQDTVPTLYSVATSTYFARFTPLRNSLSDTTINKIGNLVTETNRETIPSVIYESDINEALDGLASDAAIVYYLPSSMTYIGEKITLTWEVFNSATGVAATNNKTGDFIRTNSTNGGIEFYINKTNIGNVFATNNPLALVNSTIYLRCSKYNTLGVLIGARVVAVPIQFVAETGVQAVARRLPLYYFQTTAATPSAANPYVRADSIIKDEIFLYSLFNHGYVNTSSGLITASYLTTATVTAATQPTFPDSKVGDTVHYISYTNLGNVTSLTMSWSITYGYNQFTSIEGIDIFRNLRTLSISDMAITDLSPLKNVTTLTTFTYTRNSSDTTVYTVRLGDIDFTPLYASANSLTSISIFGYGALETVPDLTFLKYFPNLSTVYYAYTTNATTAYFLDSVPFRSLVAWFEMYRPNTQFIVYSTATAMPPSYLTNEVITTTSARLRASTELKKAAAILNDLSVNGSGVSVTNNFLFTINTYSYQFNNKYKQVELPAYIVSSAKYYAINWYTMSSYINFGGYRYTGETFTLSQGSQKTYANGNILTYTDLVELLNDYNFIQMLFLKKADVAAIMNINYTVNHHYNLYQIVARINVDGFDYDSIFYINKDNLAS